jgi:membrane-associated protein
VPSLERLADVLTEALTRTGAWAPAILFFASFIEYVFPPFPGDLLVVLGAWYAQAGQLSWAATFVAVTAGAIAGAYVDYRVGVSLGRRIDRGAARRGALSEERLGRFEASYRRWGGWLLVANRFFPGIRAFFFLAAGASGIPLRRVLLLGGISAALWNALLLAVGAVVARNAGDLVRIFEQYEHVAWVALVAVAVVAALVYAWRRRAQRAAPEGR